MQYRTDGKSGNALSILGFGCMRFPRNVTGIDLPKSERLIARAADAGVNYYDTAYLYGGSEETLGKILHGNMAREKLHLATKLPIVKCRQQEDFDRFFDEQLAKLQTEYIDYYLMHNINTLEQWEKLCALGIEDWIKRQKDAGRARQVGFSFHGERDEFLKVIDAYDWEFCQIQYNYSNENFQAGVTGLSRAAEKGLPVIIMEPLLGGKLATGLPKKALSAFEQVNPGLSPAAWGLRWLWNQSGVTVVLSGMNSGAQLEDNLKTAEDAAPGMLTKEEEEAYRRVIGIFSETDKVPCTGCAYCMPCPQNVNIPGCFAAYNTSYSMGRITGMIQYVTTTAYNRADARHNAGQCIACGKCERHCPQNIPISKALQDVKRRMEPFYLNWGVRLASR